jgi:hypothetical protein
MIQNSGRTSLILYHRVGLLALSLFFLKEKNKGYRRNPLRKKSSKEYLR